MTRTLARAALAALVALLIAACGSSAPASSTPASSAPASQAPATASTAASPSATASAASSAAIDPMDDISIAAPYALGPLDAAASAAFEAGLKAGLGSLGTVHLGARQVRRSGADAGLVIGLSVDGVQGLNPSTFLDIVAQGAAGSAQGTVSSRTIEGRPVRLIESGTGGIAMYVRDNGTIVVAYGRAPDDAVGTITAIIQATE